MYGTIKTVKMWAVKGSDGAKKVVFRSWLLAKLVGLALGGEVALVDQAVLVD